MKLFTCFGSTLCHDFLVAQLASTKIVDLCEQAHCRQSGNHCSMNDEHGDCDACAFTHRDYLVLHIETTLFSHGTDMQVAYLTDFCILLIMCVLACGQLWSMLAYCRLDVMTLFCFLTAAHYQYCKHVVCTTDGSVPL